MTSHYLNQWWPSLLTNICVIRPQWVKSSHPTHNDIGKWEVVMMPTLPSLAALQVVVMATCAAASDAKLALWQISTEGCRDDNLRWRISIGCCRNDNLLRRQWWQGWHRDNSQFSVDTECPFAFIALPIAHPGRPCGYELDGERIIRSYLSFPGLYSEHINTEEWGPGLWKRNNGQRRDSTVLDICKIDKCNVIVHKVRVTHENHGEAYGRV